MHDFKHFLTYADDEFTKAMAETDSDELIHYLKTCNDPVIKEDYYKRMEKILGKDYCKFLKMAVCYNKLPSVDPIPS